MSRIPNKIKKEGESHLSEIGNIDFQESPYCYHYTSLEVLVDMVQKQEIWLTNSMYLNDPKEFIDFLDSFISLVKPEGPMASLESFMQKQKQPLEQFENEFLHSAHFIFSTGMNNDSLPMWNYYGKKGGVCICFNTEQLYNSFTKAVGKKAKVYKCLYNGNNKKEPLEEAIKIWETHIKENPQKGDIRYTYGEIWNVVRPYGYMFKQDVYSYEEEIRFVVECGPDIPASKVSEKSSRENSETINERGNTCLETTYVVRNNQLNPILKIKFNKFEEGLAQIPIEGITISPYLHGPVIKNGIKRLLHSNGYSGIVEEVKFSKYNIRY